MVLRSLLATTAVAGVLVGGLVAGATAADAAPSDSSQGNCPDARPVPGKSDSLLVEAPAGQVITGYCVKSAGLKGTTGAPETVVLATPVSSLVLRHTEGGNLTHYTLFTAPAATEPEEPTDPQEPVDPQEPTDPQEPVDPETPEEPVDPETPEEPVEEPESTPNPPVTTPGGGFDWDWTYETPGCDGLVVAYPSNIPEGQSNDVNIRLMTDQGEITLNYHLDEGTWSGTTAFVYSQHRLWPADVTSYTVVWTQVGGTNYHWQGAVECALGEPSPTTGTRNGYAVVKPGTDGTDGTVPGEPAADLVAGYRTGTTTLARGQRLGADTIVVSGLEGRTLELQRLKKGTWSTIGTVATTDGTATVTYPKQAKRGTVGYRLVAGDWTSEVLTVRIR